MVKIIQLPGITLPQLVTNPIYNGSHFTWGEATRNGERMPEQTNFDGVIIPAAQITSNIIKIAKELDQIRSEFGDRPITVTSWLRPPAVNKAVNGARRSQHLCDFKHNLA
jgi:zinc D-Ala-D-Ala carboxypeptidase